MAATYLGFRWIDKYGRKALAIGGYTGMIVFALVTGLGLAATSGTLRLVVIMIGLDFFIASFAVGVGGVGWTLQGEVFPTAVRGQAAAFAAMVDWLANFALIEVFPVYPERHQPGRRHGGLRGLCALAIVFVLEVPARDQEPAGRGDRPGLRAAAEGGRPAEGSLRGLAEGSLRGQAEGSLSELKPGPDSERRLRRLADAASGAGTVGPP